MTSTTTRRPAAPMTALDETQSGRWPRFLSGYERVAGGVRRRQTGLESWGEMSADGLWAYVRTETPGTPWVVLYLPTGQDAMFTSLPKARRWTATADAVPFLRRQAADVVDRKGEDGRILFFQPGTPETERAEVRRRAAAATLERLGRARRQLAIHDGEVLAGRLVGRCTGGAAGCGGYLTTTMVAGRLVWVHADACRECLTDKTDERRECRNLHAHVPCADPEPVTCDHAGCASTAVSLVAGAGCPRGRDACCGCCRAEAEAADPCDACCG